MFLWYVKVRNARDVSFFVWNVTPLCVGYVEVVVINVMRDSSFLWGGHQRYYMGFRYSYFPAI